MNSLDRFPLQPKLLFNKSYAHSTWFGLSATIIVFSLSLLTLGSFSENFLYKKGPIISSSESNFKDIPTFDLDDTDFKMAFFFVTNKNNSYVMDSSFFKIEAFQTRVYMSEENKLLEEHFKLELERCKTDHFPKDENIQKSFQKLGIFQSLCMKKQQKHSPRLVGIWGQENFERITIKYSRCMNSTSK